MSLGNDAPQQKTTVEEKELAKIADEQWQYYQDGGFMEAENKYMDEVNEMGYSEPKLDKLRGRVGASTDQSFADTVDKTMGGLTQAGVDPSSGRWQEASAGLSDARGASEAGALVDSRENMKDRHVSGLQNVVSIGQGQSAESTAGLSEMAQMGAQEAQQDAATAASLDQAQAGLAGSLAGVGMQLGMSQGMFGGGGGLSGGKSGGASATGPQGNQWNIY